MSLRGQKITVTGSRGFLGSYVRDELKTRGVKDEDLFLPASSEYDLRTVDDCLRAVRGQDIVVHLAAKVGDAKDQKAKPGEFFYDNLLLGSQMIEAARLAKVKKLVLIGSIHAYPAKASEPLKENSLWDGYPEESNAPYGLAKRILTAQIRAYADQYGFSPLCLIFPNLYGPRFDVNNPRSFIQVMIRKISKAKIAGDQLVEFSGTGLPAREFLYAGDAARAITLALSKYGSPEPLNIGSGEVVTLRVIAEKIARLIGFLGKIVWTGENIGNDSTRSLDSSRAKSEIGFQSQTKFDEGLKLTIDWYRSQING